MVSVLEGEVVDGEGERGKVVERDDVRERGRSLI